MKSTFYILISFFFLSSNAHSQAYNALHFDGVDDYVTCALPPVFNSIGTNDFTIEMWVKQDNSQFCRLVYAQKDADNIAVVSLNATNEIVFYLTENANNHSVQTTNQITNGQWTHIAVRWDASLTEAAIFINGTEASYAGGVFVSSTATDNTMTIGSRTDGAQVFSGTMEELAIWDVARTQCEIALNVYHSHALVSNTVALYGFNEGNASGTNAGITTANDYAGFLHGTLMGFGLSGNTSNWVLSGVPLGNSNVDPNYVLINGTVLSPDIPGDSYQWINCADSLPIAGATNMNFDPTIEDPAYVDGATSEYAVWITQSGCSQITFCRSFSTASINGLPAAEKLAIYPNPSDGTFFVELPEGAEEIEVLSLNGELIERFYPTTLEKMQLDLPYLNGMYLVRVKTQSTIISSKISILH